jgi:hypothetical protein
MRVAQRARLAIECSRQGGHRSQAMLWERAWLGPRVGFSPSSASWTRERRVAGSYRPVCERTFHLVGKRTQPAAPVIVEHQAKAKVAGRQTRRAAAGAGIRE